MKRSNSSLEPIQELFREFSTLQKFNEIEWVEIDLLDIPSLSVSLQGIKTIFHTAGCVGFDDREKELIRQINVEGTENLVNLAISEKIPEFVYISSIAVLDEVLGERSIDENSKFDTEKMHSEYAISKKKGEMAVWRGSQEGLKVLVVYPSVVIGSLDGKRASEKIFQLASRKKMFATEGITGYVDVRDVAFCMAELAGKEIWNQGFIVTSEDKSYTEIFNFLRDKWGLDPVKSLSESKLKFIQKVSQISRLFGGPYMGLASYHALSGSAKYSNQKIKETISRNFISVEGALTFHAEKWRRLQS